MVERSSEHDIVVQFKKDCLGRLSSTKPPWYWVGGKKAASTVAGSFGACLWCRQGSHAKVPKL